MRRVALLGVLLATVAAAALALAVARIEANHGDAWIGRDSGPALALQLTSAAAAWLVALTLLAEARLRASAVLLAGAAVALVVGSAPAAEIDASALFTAALVAAWLAPALPVAAALLYGGPGRPDRLLAIAIVGCAGLAALATTATYDPPREGCTACATNLLAVDGTAGAHETATRAALAAMVVWGLAVVVLAAGRLAIAHPVVRRTRAPIAVVACALGATAAATGAHRLWRFGDATDAVDRAFWLGGCALLLLLALAIVAQRLHTRVLARRLGADLAAALPDRARIERALTTSAGDPRLALAFPHDAGRLIDADGREAPPAGDATVLAVARGAATVAEVRYRPAHAAATVRVSEVARTAGLGLEHLGGRARLRAELRELQESRSRVVETADAERRALERDLHDGAQQRLIAVSAGLRRARDTAAPPDRERLDAAIGEVSAALADLRSLATAVHPAALTEAGLAAALADLGERSAVPLRVEAVPSGRFPAGVETAAFRVVADAVEAAGRDTGRRAVVAAIEARDGALEVVVQVPAADPGTVRERLGHAGDRVAALGGELAVDGASTSVRIAARVPCGS